MEKFILFHLGEISGSRQYVLTLFLLIVVDPTKVGSNTIISTQKCKVAIVTRFTIVQQLDNKKVYFLFRL